MRQRTQIPQVHCSPGSPQRLRIAFSFVAQWVEAGDRDESRRQPGQRFGQQRRQPRIRRIDIGIPEVLRVEPIDVPLGQQEAIAEQAH
ncbi:Uncharacterised protein [Mycobacterium tuberculosis]|uniref:Uncharacterized protein n=1 Tax=Mycobacterium tuberculosis TaxID=1773 RepID=A0A655IN75_MYCTX|nr:Uncharacterised protein [Mycobacterium tuberculosis]COX05647.1 Uncharacterised protein [Mycobacterium tuberculosis]CPA38323.1 Uncharacterised protein [Mycobacterium tuberculosis]